FAPRKNPTPLSPLGLDIRWDQQKGGMSQPKNTQTLLGSKGFPMKRSLLVLSASLVASLAFLTPVRAQYTPPSTLNLHATNYNPNQLTLPSTLNKHYNPANRQRNPYAYPPSPRKAISPGYRSVQVSPRAPVQYNRPAPVPQSAGNASVIG